VKTTSVAITSQVAGHVESPDLVTLSSGYT